MRGNQVDRHPRNALLGSIPAHAGEPSQSRTPAAGARVYPRACGGTWSSRCWPTIARGLSPRMRGNPSRTFAPAGRSRSIPAHAGEPRSKTARRSRSRVYPRACGGTPSVNRALYSNQGLSPRMRGNRLLRGYGTAKTRSIPAHAGEPDSIPRRPSWRRVYPRACGGTVIAGAGVSVMAGLSPRMRGNRAKRDARRAQAGSIPAHAGEPGSGGSRSAGSRRSIPAHAGEPLSLTVYGGRCGAIGFEPMPATGLRPPPEPRQLSWCCCELGRSRNFPRSEIQRCRAICTGCQVHPPPEI